MSKFFLLKWIISRVFWLYTAINIKVQNSKES